MVQPRQSEKKTHVQSPPSQRPRVPQVQKPKGGTHKGGPPLCPQTHPLPHPPSKKKRPTTTPKPNQVRSPAPSLAQRPSSHTLVIVVRDSASPHDVIGRLAAPDLLLVRSTPRPLQAPRERKPTPASATPPPAGGMATRRHARTLWRRDLDAITGDRRPPERPMSGGAPITRPHAPKRGMTTAAREGWRRRALDLLGGEPRRPHPSLPAVPCPDCAPIHRPTANGSGRDARQGTREGTCRTPGGVVPGPPCPPQWSGIAPTRARREARAPRSNVVQCSAAQALRHVKAGAGHRTVPGGALPPRTPPPR